MCVISEDTVGAIAVGLEVILTDDTRVDCGGTSVGAAGRVGVIGDEIV